jgi:hypothetical protein
MGSLATQMTRYASMEDRDFPTWSPLLCEWFFKPALYTLGGVHGELGHQNRPGEVRNVFPGHDAMSNSIQPKNYDPTTVMRNHYTEADWVGFFRGVAMKIFKEASHYGFERLREKGERPPAMLDTIDKGGQKCHSSLVFGNLRDLQWSAFLATIETATGNGDEVLVPWGGGDQLFPPFAVVVALIIQWAAAELKR